MGLVTGVTLPNDGDRIKATNYNDPINKLLTQVNGNLDSTNISSLSGSKLSAGSVPQTALDSSNFNGWGSIGQAFTYTANNGNKEFTGTFPADVTGTLSAGMKLKLSRSVTPPTQCMNFTAGSTQYATIASPSGIVFTSAFTLEAWIYIKSYPTAGNDSSIISRRTSGGGFALVIEPTGQLRTYYTDGSGNNTVLDSNQSIPLKRWVHVAGVVTSVLGKTGALYINGTSVSFSFAASGATALVQTGPLQIGATNSVFPFDGYVSEARVWPTARTQSQIQDNMAISLTGSEGMVALFQGNGNFTDKTSNGNNLTAVGGAIPTQAANPYNSTEYAIITKVGSYSGGVTPITLSTGHNGNIPNMVLSNVQYSTADNPYGLPDGLCSAPGRRLLNITVSAQFQTTSTTGVQFPPITSLVFTVPQNCNNIKICVYNPSFSTSGTAVFKFYNGAINTLANELVQWNYTANNSGISMSSLIPVVPGETITLNAGWLTTSGTLTWSSGGANRQNPAIWVETA